MIDPALLPEIKEGETFTIDLTSLAYEFLSPDEFEAYAQDGGELEIGGGTLVFECNESSPADPYIDLHMGGQVAAMDGESVQVISNDPASSVMVLVDDDGEVPAEFTLDYGTLSACIGE